MEEHDDHYDNLALPDTLRTASDHVEAGKRRRPHKKSRNGCQQCKRRRIKLETPDLEVRKRGRPRKNWTVVSVEGRTAAPSECNATALVTSTPLASSLANSSMWHVERPLHLPWDAEDLELFFHYQNEVCAGMGGFDLQLWKDRTPRLAFRRHGVLHLLLAVSALHLSRQEPLRRRRLEERAEVHLAIGLLRTTDILPNLSAENCAELYVATILVCTCTFAKRPGPDNLLVVADGAEVAWWDLFRGVRIIVETIGIQAVFAGELGPMPSDTQGDRQDKSPHPHHVVPVAIVDWEDALDRLSVPISAVGDESVRGACQSALCIMKWCFQETYGTAVRPKSTPDAKFNNIMVWLYCLSEEFVGSLKEQEPASLILLAYFTVLLRTLATAWFMEGWAAHILQRVSEILGRTWNEWLQWPALQSKDSGALLTS
ncbi:unnamed protein product [Clonostachys solani]|uniref:Uncharacterized protein n=1 Tax=Clonostachys solani TaxID=160281 RepID=A0A9N9Z8U0_9HYPO|nr:unnamed protein product [Clonostachys solani]